ncbi:MAG TPA: hypothetical protein VLH56_16865 [Dissulfurispiraceae bacterium]|nr:hypothetical protein [Dissulfurispiraceae bacterium]
MADKNKTRRQRIVERNQKIEKQFIKLQNKHPRWRSDAIIEVLADEFFLSKATVAHILAGHYERFFFKTSKKEDHENI